MPNSLNSINIWWMKFGELLGLIFSPIILALIFYLVILPTSILMKIFKKDILELKFNTSKKSYWISKKENIGPMKNQF